jgi:hypothetical protein
MKTFMLYLRTFFLCFGMLHLSMMPGYVLAQENKSSRNVEFPGIVEQAEESQSDSNSKSNDQSSLNSTVESREGKGVGTNAVDGLMDLVTMIAIGLLAKSLILYTPITSDMMIASAGGAAYLYAEISALKATKKKMESKTFELTRYEDGSTNNLQREALEKQKKSYEDLAAMLDQKAAMKKMAATAFLSAAAVALIWQAKLKAAEVSCLTAAHTEGVAECSGSLGTACWCEAAALKSSGEQAGIEAMGASPDANSMQGKVQMMSASKTQMVPLATACTVSAPLCTTVDTLRNLLTSGGMPVLFSVFIATGAGATLIDQMGIGMLAGLISSVFISTQGFFDTMMTTPWKRAISYGGLAALAYLGASTSEKQAAIMRRNAQTIQKMLYEMYNLQDVSVANLKVQNQQLRVKNALVPIEGFNRGISSEELICGPNAKEKKQDGVNCESQQQRISDNVDKEQKKGLGNLPAAVLGVAGQVGNVADSLRETGGLTDGAFSDAQELSSNSEALRRLNSRIKNQLNKDRERYGKDPIDFEEKEKEFVGSFNKAILKTLDNNPGETSRALAAYKDQSPKDLNDKSEEDEVLASLGTTKNFNSTTSQGPAAFKIPEVKSGDYGFGLDEETQKDPTVIRNKNGATVVNVDANLNTDGKDIVSNKDVSIFKVISVRYMKSGIPRLIDLE